MLWIPLNLRKKFCLFFRFAKKSKMRFFIPFVPSNGWGFDAPSKTSRGSARTPSSFRIRAGVVASRGSRIFCSRTDPLSDEGAIP